MKKLLLFIIVLFGSMSAMSLADGCAAQVCTCPGGGYVTTGQYCPVSNDEPMIVDPYIGAIAVNKNTGKWSSVSNIKGTKNAKADVLSRCGSDCEVIIVGSKRCVGVAYSSSDKILASDSATDNFGGIGYNTRVKRSNDKALKKCEKNGGQNCKIIVNVCAIEGTTKY